MTDQLSHRTPQHKERVELIDANEVVNSARVRQGVEPDASPARKYIKHYANSPKAVKFQKRDFQVAHMYAINQVGAFYNINNFSTSLGRYCNLCGMPLTY